MNYVQETDSKMIFPIIEEVKNRGGITSATETILPFIENHLSETAGAKFVPDRIKDALNKVNDHRNADVRNRVENVLNQIQKIITAFTCIGFDLNMIPKIHAFTYETDEAILLEWIFDEYRIGLSIEVIESESSWYLVTNESLGDINASGFLTDENLILWLMNFIMAYS